MSAGKYLSQSRIPPNLSPRWCPSPRPVCAVAIRVPSEPPDLCSFLQHCRARRQASRQDPEKRLSVPAQGSRHRLHMAPSKEALLRAGKSTSNSPEGAGERVSKGGRTGGGDAPINSQDKPCMVRKSTAAIVSCPSLNRPLAISPMDSLPVPQ